MSSAALSKGSTRPPNTPGKYRLYSMEYCPFAQRVRIVLLAKNIAHDIVNIDLGNKPEWIFDVNPKGLVPALDTGDEVVVESLDILKFLDKKFPDPPLYPSDTGIISKDEVLLKKFEPVPQKSMDIVRKKIPEIPEEIISFYQAFNEELQQRGTPFLGGSSPGMIDYIIWPWVERAYVPQVLTGKDKFLEEGSTKFPKVGQWKKKMEAVKAVAETVHPLEQFVALWKKYFNL